MGYGENGSVIGPINTPTSSVASGVWSLGEVAEAVRDSIWPAPQFSFEKIATITPGSSVSTLTFSGIPQTFRHLEVHVFDSSSQTYVGQGSVAVTTDATNATAATNNSVAQMAAGNVGSNSMSDYVYANFTTSRLGVAGDNLSGAVYKIMWTNYSDTGTANGTPGDGGPAVWEGASSHNGSTYSQISPYIGGSERSYGSGVSHVISSITIASAASTNYMGTAKFVLYGWREA